MKITFKTFLQNAKFKIFSPSPRKILNIKTHSSIEKDLFEASALSEEQKIAYLSAKDAHIQKRSEDSFFTMVLKNFEAKNKGEPMPYTDLKRVPAFVVKRWGKITAVAILDGYPINRGHALIFPKRQVDSFFKTTKKEKKDLLKAMNGYKKLLEKTLTKKNLPVPLGYNIGINDGFVAGQTVPHLHIQFIPRYFGDVPNPHGGVRGVKGSEETFPFHGKIWESQKYTGTPDLTVDDLFK